MSRTAKLLVAAGAAVLLLFAAVTALVGWNSVQQARPITSTCGNAVSLYFADDADMRKAAERLGGDGRVGNVRSETHEQAEQRLRQWRSSSSSTDLTQAVPAVHLAARDPAERERLARELRKELSGAKASRPADCALARDARKLQLLQFRDMNCGRVVGIFFDGDQDMQAAAGIVRRDERVVKVVTVTSAQAYERAKVAFRGQPDLLKAIHPDNIPTSIEITASPKTDPRALGTELSKKLDGASGVQTTLCITVPHPVVRPVR